MKPEDSITPAPADMPVATQAHATEGVQNDVGLKLSLEAAGLGRSVVLHCEGVVISRSEVRALSGMIAEVLPSAGRMVVDLEGVASLDSHALGELVLSQMWAGAAGFGLTFANPNDSMRRLFESTRLDSVFDVYASVGEALEAMQPGAVHSA